MPEQDGGRGQGTKQVHLIYNKAGCSRSRGWGAWRIKAMPRTMAQQCRGQQWSSWRQCPRRLKDMRRGLITSTHINIQLDTQVWYSRERLSHKHCDQGRGKNRAGRTSPVREQDSETPRTQRKRAHLNGDSWEKKQTTSTPSFYPSKIIQDDKLAILNKNSQIPFQVSRLWWVILFSIFILYWRLTLMFHTCWVAALPLATAL